VRETNVHLEKETFNKKLPNGKPYRQQQINSTKNATSTALLTMV
jgi:hypothetical protein